ncbi:PRC and DUF2382 domain-containing protein [Nocardia brasiliensis]|uniref:PRC and DUF2382 domain-containing protein n=1 Tax=Nocardia brasiliensis TaxID=37326 RepID=UPI001896301F|nr:PRC and DUF2382 domain-containing protein [Nocardia brasiliensis]MBF6128625.1 PRC and DUF2382 domain-containing protein [Nocardia brasiliensis]MBF6544391.1 PRC and DUF2382 domain-containing protein [Nocardia brasiliensis]
MTGMLEELIGSAVLDQGGDKIGKVKRVYVDNTSGSPTWVAVSTGMFSDDSLVPLAGAELRHDPETLQVRVEKSEVKSAPHLDHDGLISAESERELFAHYHIDPNRAGWDMGGKQQMRGGMRPDEAAGLVRSEERLAVGKETEEAGTARLHKYVVTEEQSVTVPTTHEEVRIEREPITDPSAVGRADIGEQEREVTLHEERVTVNKETVPVERVRLAVDQVEDSETVSGTVRKERIEAEGVDKDRQRRHDR